MSEQNAFQPNAFQGGAFQTDALPAFLGAAFERDAFQVGIGGFAFQADAFCGEHFLSEGVCRGTTRTAPALPEGAIRIYEAPEDEDGIAAVVAALAARRW